MSKHYKIHPGIGVARVGQSQDGYFLAPETVDGSPFELSPGGEVELRGYKDASFLIRRQGVRFRVFEYERDDMTGALAFTGEVTPDKATIHWSVALGNRKAAGPLMVSSTGPQGERVIVPRTPGGGVSLRNNNVADRSQLATAVSLSGIDGVNRALQALRGRIMNQDVLLGEAGTDPLGRLVVLGGVGQSASWQTPMAELRSFLNNDGWVDDIADGPVDAELEFPDGTRQRVQDGAWAIVGPPDFAPEVQPLISLYDLMLDTLIQAGRLPHPSRVSFQQDIRPLLERAAGLRWVNRKALWSDLATMIQDLAALADRSEGARPGREDVRNTLLQSETELDGFRLTRTQKEDLLNNWVEGRFESDLNALGPQRNAAEELDRAALTRCMGSGLFPGIEMGFLATNPALYAELGRFTRAPFNDFNGPNTLEAGAVTQRMALPWQADFMECAVEWWPVQRPDTALFREDGSPTPANFRWDRGLVVPQPDDFGSPQSHLNMVLHFAKLGVLDRITVDGEQVMAETGRSPELGG